MNRIGLARLLGGVLAFGLLLTAGSARAWRQRDFALGYWNPPPPSETTADRYREIAAAGFNLAMGGNGVDGPGPTQAMLDLCRKEKMTALILDSRLYGGKADAVLAIVKAYGRQPAVEGYLVQDEPGTAQFPALRDTVAALRAADGKRLALINLFPIYASPAQLGAPTYEAYVEQYLDTVKPDLLCFDHYPFTRTGERPDFLENLEIIRRQSLGHKIPFWAIVQAEGIEGAYRSPSEMEMRCQVFTALAYGARGILYFTYWTPDPSGGEAHFDGILAKGGKARARYEWVTRLNEQVRRLAPLLMDLKSRGVYQVGTTPTGTRPASGEDVIQTAGGGPATIGIFDGPSHHRFLWIVNRSTTRETTVNLAFDAGRVARLFEHGLDGKVSDNLMRTDLKFPAAYDVQLGPGEGRLFEIPEILR